jgi:hypothetical protein
MWRRSGYQTPRREHQADVSQRQTKGRIRAGVGLRINVFGYLVVGVNYVKPFDRQGKGWYFQFSFWPGF